MYFVFLSINMEVCFSSSEGLCVLVNGLEVGCLHVCRQSPSRSVRVTEGLRFHCQDAVYPCIGCNCLGKFFSSFFCSADNFPWWFQAFALVPDCAFRRVERCARLGRGSFVGLINLEVGNVALDSPRPLQARVDHGNSYTTVSVLTHHKTFAHRKETVCNWVNRSRRSCPRNTLAKLHGRRSR